MLSDSLWSRTAELTDYVVGNGKISVPHTTAKDKHWRI